MSGSGFPLSVAGLRSCRSGVTPFRIHQPEHDGPRGLSGIVTAAPGAPDASPRTRRTEPNPRSGPVVGEPPPSPGPDAPGERVPAARGTGGARDPRGRGPPLPFPPRCQGRDLPPQSGLHTAESDFVSTPSPRAMPTGSAIAVADSSGLPTPAKTPSTRRRPKATLLPGAGRRSGAAGCGRPRKQPANATIGDAGVGRHSDGRGDAGGDRAGRARSADPVARRIFVTRTASNRALSRRPVPTHKPEGRPANHPRHGKPSDRLRRGESGARLSGRFRFRFAQENRLRAAT